MIEQLIVTIQENFGKGSRINLHEPRFSENEHRYVADCITTTMVSSVGAYVDKFEIEFAKYVGYNDKAAVAVANGTSGLQLALHLVGVGPGDFVITQALTFVATANAISHCGADPVFCDVDRDTLGLSPASVEHWLQENAKIVDDGPPIHKTTSRTIRACIPMHTFGHPVHILELLSVCHRWNLPIVEDAAESLGSSYGDQQTGSFGAAGVFSFNGNKIITTGGGGMIVAPHSVAARAKHLSTTAKKPHTFEYDHDTVAWNFRMPNINAALGLAQFEKLDQFLRAKRNLADYYLSEMGKQVKVMREPENAQSNYWLNAIICDDKNQRDAVLKETNDIGIATRPIWKLMTDLPMYNSSFTSNLKHSYWLADRVVNIPSSVTDINL